MLKRFAGQIMQMMQGGNNYSDRHYKGMSRRELDDYMLGYDFPFPAKDIYELNRIAEKITAERGEPMTYENIRRNGIEYGENTFGRYSVDWNETEVDDIELDPNDPDLMEF